MKNKYAVNDEYRSWMYDLFFFRALVRTEIIDRLRNVFPDHAILAEESGSTQGDKDKKWIIDPLDGSLNYSHGYPCYCVSIGMEHNGELVVGVIYNPNLDELFVAEKGKGAWMEED